MKADDINTVSDAENFCEGLLNDFELGISDKATTMKQLARYTHRLQELFWENAKKKIKANPELLNK